MFFAASKILSFLIMPLTWIFLLFLLSFFWKKHSHKLRIASIVLLFLFSNGFVMHQVNTWWEWPVVKKSALPPTEVAIVLGGYSRYDTLSKTLTFTNTADRLLQGYQILQTGKSQKLLLSGGSGYLSRPDLLEGVFVKEYLNSVHVGDSAILLDATSRNTHENAVNSAAILDSLALLNQPVILVTSAFHMRRSVACFEKAGVRVIPFPTDPLTGDINYSVELFLMPSPFVLAHWNVLTHEWFGYLSYWLMNYV